MAGKKKQIGRKVTKLLLSMVFLAMLLMGIVSIWSLYSMKDISADTSKELGKTAAEDAEEALENMAGEQLQAIAVEKADYIEEKFGAVTACLHGIADQAEKIYADPDSYPDRTVSPPKVGEAAIAAQLLCSEKLQAPTEEETKELLKLGNIQDMLLQYNANSEMISSTYVATETGWMIQADYISYTKFEEGSETPSFYEANTRQWYQRAKQAGSGEVVYTDVIKDIHEGGDCIVCAQPVYHNGQIVAVAGVGSYLETVNEAVWNTTIGEKGYAFLLNEKGQVMVSLMKEGETAAYAEENVDLRMSKNQQLAHMAKDMVAGKTGMGKLFIDGREVYLAYAPLKNLGWSFVTVMDVEEVVAPAKESQNMILQLTQNAAQIQDGAIRRMLMLFMAMVAAVAVLIGIISTLFTGKITEPIRRLTNEVAKIDGGNLDYRIDIATGDEIEDLGNAFNHMTDQIHQYIQSLNSVTAEKERIRTEIQVASQLQADMLPNAKNAYEDRDEFSLYAIMTPAKGVGGDFYDFFLLDDDHLALIMADVSGKGVPAALFMVVSRTLLRSHIVKGVPLNQAVEKVNDSLCKNNKNGMFVTAWIGVFTISTGKLTFVNAGHCRPLIRRADGTCTYETTISGLVLAGMEETKYRQSEIRFNQGDTIFLYTDGVTEATDSQNNLYGEKRLEQLMKVIKQQEPRDILFEVWKDVNRFQGKAEQFDDITMLALRYNGNGYTVMTDTAKIDNILKFNRFVDDILTKAQFSQKASTKIRIAMDEIFSNVCYYSGANEITVGCKIKDREASIYFEDDGMPYNPLEKPDPDVTELLEERKAGGLGIYLVKKRMDKIWYEFLEGRNRLVIVKEDEG